MDFMEIIKRIAKKNNTAPEEVLQEMQTAIEAAYNTREASGQPIWDKIAYAAQKVQLDRR